MEDVLIVFINQEGFIVDIDSIQAHGINPSESPVLPSLIRQNA